MHSGYERKEAGSAGSERRKSDWINMDRNRNKINILHLRDSPWLDGPGRTILETASAIDSSRFGYFIGAFVRNGTAEHPFIDAASRKKTNIIKISESGTFDFSTVYQILKIIGKEKIDILHTHEVRSDILGLLCGKMKRIPVVVTLHGWIENDRKGKILTKLDKWLLRYFDHIVAVSDKMKKEVVGVGVNGKNVSVLYNALVIENYRRDPDDSIFRKQFGIKDEMFLVGNIGRLSPEKGQADFIRAAAEVLKYCKNVKFALIGSGSDETYLRELADELNIRDSVIFTGYRNDMLQVYNSLDLVVQSSRTEGMPNVILEALAMETPVIATDVGGTLEAIINNYTGILIRPGDPRELAEKIIEYLKNPGLLAGMVKNGRKLIEMKFNFTERTEKLCRIYDALMREKARDELSVA